MKKKLSYVVLAGVFFFSSIFYLEAGCFAKAECGDGHTIACQGEDNCKQKVKNNGKMKVKCDGIKTTSYCPEE